MSLYLAAAIFCKHYRGVNRAVVKSSSTPEYKKNEQIQNKTSKQDQKAAAYKNRGNQPNSIGNYFKSLCRTQNKDVLTGRTEPQPGKPFKTLGGY